MKADGLPFAVLNESPPPASTVGWHCRRTARPGRGLGGREAVGRALRCRSSLVRLAPLRPVGRDNKPETVPGDPEGSTVRHATGGSGRGGAGRPGRPGVRPADAPQRGQGNRQGGCGNPYAAAFRGDRRRLGDASTVFLEARAAARPTRSDDGLPATSPARCHFSDAATPMRK